HVFIQSFVLDLLLLTLGTMILPDPGVERVFIHAQITSGQGNGLIRLHGQFHGAFLEFCGIFFGRGLTHRTHLIRCMMSLFPCVRKSVATSRCTSVRQSGPPTSAMKASTAPLASPERCWAISGSNTSNLPVPSVVFGGSSNTSECTTDGALHVSCNA